MRRLWLLAGIPVVWLAIGAVRWSMREPKVHVQAAWSGRDECSVTGAARVRISNQEDRVLRRVWIGLEVFESGNSASVASDAATAWTQIVMPGEVKEGCFPLAWTNGPRTNIVLPGGTEGTVLNSEFSRMPPGTVVRSSVDYVVHITKVSAEFYEKGEQIPR